MPLFAATFDFIREFEEKAKMIDSAAQQELAQMLMSGVRGTGPRRLYDCRSSWRGGGKTTISRGVHRICTTSTWHIAGCNPGHIGYPRDLPASDCTARTTAVLRISDRVAHKGYRNLEPAQGVRAVTFCAMLF
jgi:hypothetical protein